jgi:D-glutamate cyclase
MPHQQLISELESIVRRDPAKRGLIAPDGEGPGRGELARAASFFAPDFDISGVGLITGFFIPSNRQGDHENEIAKQHTILECRNGHAETDGPPGTVVLADVLANLRIPTSIITDELCEPVVLAACNAAHLQAVKVLASPIDRQRSAAWRTQVLSTTPISQITHFVAIERVGPGYAHPEHAENQPAPATDQQNGQPGPSGWQPGHCCNMRGESIDAFSADLHLMIESAKARNPRVNVIGIGDGGNEVGMGRFPKEELVSRIISPNAHRIPCRIPADATIVAGVSNWGAYALTAAIAVQHDRVDLLERHSAAAQQQLLERIVSEAGAVDGITRRNEPTVDGLPFLTQIQPWIAIRKCLGLNP